MSSRDQVFPGFVHLSHPRISISLIGGQEEEVSRLTDAGRPTSISAEHERFSAHYTNTAWMPFDAREGPNQPILLEFSYALFPQSYPTMDFSVVLWRFLRWSGFSAGNRHGWLIRDAEGGSYLRGFITYA
jgi:hypothetical protein